MSNILYPHHDAEILRAIARHETWPEDHGVAFPAVAVHTDAGMPYGAYGWIVRDNATTALAHTPEEERQAENARAAYAWFFSGYGSADGDLVDYVSHWEGWDR